MVERLILLKFLIFNDVLSPSLARSGKSLKFGFFSPPIPVRKSYFIQTETFFYHLSLNWRERSSACSMVFSIFPFLYSNFYIILELYSDWFSSYEESNCYSAYKLILFLSLFSILSLFFPNRLQQVYIVSKEFHFLSLYINE